LTLLVEKGTFTKPTGTGAQSQTVTLANGSLTPKFVILWTNALTTNNGTYAENVVWSYGFSDGTNDVCQAMVALDNVTTQNEAYSWNNNCIISILSTAATPAQLSRADVTSFNAGNFVLNWSVQTDTTAMVIHYIVGGGTDITNVSAISTTVGSLNAGSLSYTGSGTTFTPDFALTMTGTQGSATANTLHVGADMAALNIGAARTTTQEYCMCGRTETIGTSDTDMFLANNACVACLNTGTGAVAFLADFVSFDNAAGGGITINVTNNADTTGMFLGFLLIKGGVWEVGTFQQRSGTGTQDVSFANTALNPELVYLGGINSATANASVINNYLAMGASDGTNEGCSWGGDQSDQATMVNTRANLNTKVYRQATPNATAGSSTTNAEADMNDMATAGKFQLNWTTASATLHQMGFWTLGTVATGAQFDRSPSVDTVTVSESSLTRMLSSARAPSVDTSTVTDASLTRTTQAFRAPSADSITIADASLTGVIIKARAPSADTTTIADASLVRLLSSVRNPSDTTTVTDASLTRMTQAIRVPNADTTTVDESLSGGKLLERQPSADSTTVADASLVRLLSAIRNPISDTTTVTAGTATRMTQAFRAPGQDTTVITEASLTRLLSAIRAPGTDSTTVVEVSLVRLLMLGRAPTTDSISIADASLTRMLSAARNPTEDTTAVGELLARVTQAFRTTGDTTTLGENVTREFTSGAAGQFNRSVNDTITVTDATLTRLLSASRAPVDTTTISELVASISHARMLEETVSVGTENLNRLTTMARMLSDNVVIGEQVFGTGVAPNLYATPAEVRPLLGNIGGQRTDPQIQLAIDAATDEINRKTNRLPPNDWQTSEAAYDLVKKLARYIAAVEMSIGIKDFENDRKTLQEEIIRMFELLVEYDVDAAATTDFVEGGSYESWPLSETGKIWSVRYRNLRKMPTGDNSQYATNEDNLQ
jgi:hypothetical protein